MALSPELQSTKEAAIRARKVTFASECRNLADTLGQGFNSSSRLYKYYFDNQFNSGGASEISDDDLAEFGFTPQQLAAFVGLMEQVVKMGTNQAVVQGDYLATANALK